MYYPGFSENANDSLQMAGSASARVGIVFNSDVDSDSNSLIFMKVFEIATSSFRSVMSQHHTTILYSWLAVNPFEFLMLSDLKVSDY